MKENAILVRPLDIEKVYVDFSKLDNLYEILGSDRLSTIHTLATQELSQKLGFHLIGFVARDGDDINNRKACEISGYDYIGSFMLLCKTDDAWNALPLEEEELASLYAYLTGGQLPKGSEAFASRYGIDGIVLPELGIEPKVYYKEEVPYLILFRYDLSPILPKKIGDDLQAYAKRIEDGGFTEIDGVHLSPDKKYYIHPELDSENAFYNVLVEAKGEEPILIVNAQSTVDGFLGKVPTCGNDAMDTAPEEDGDYDEDTEDEANEERNDREELGKYIIVMDLAVEMLDPETPTRYQGKYAYPLFKQNIDEEDLGNLPILGRVLRIDNYNLRKPYINITLMLGEKDVRLCLRPCVKEHVDIEIEEGEFLVRGTLSLILLKFDVGDYKSHDRVIIEETKIQNDGTGEVMRSEKGKLRVKYHNDESVSIGYGIYSVLLVGRDCRFALIQGTEIDNDGYVDTYYPVFKDEPNVQKLSFSYEGTPYLTVTKFYYQKERPYD